jgi:uncharacterized protein (PEP-CTERM system associated)
MESCKGEGVRHGALSKSERVFLRTVSPAVLIFGLLSGTADAQIISQFPGANTSGSEALPSSSSTPSPFDAVSADTTAQSTFSNAPALQLTGSVSLEETYTSNAAGATTLGSSASDEYTRARLQLDARYNSRREKLVADYSLIGDYYGKYHYLNEYINYLSLASSTQIIPDHLIINVTGFASPTMLSRLGPVSAGGELLSSSNNSNTYGYQVAPEYILRFRDIVTSTTTLSQSGVYFDFPSVVNPRTGAIINTSNATSVGAIEQLRGGDYFGRLNWRITGSYNKLTQQSFSEVQKDGVVEIAYAINRNFQILATGGYDSLQTNSPLLRSLSGPEALGGFAFTPSPSLKLVAQAGTRNNSPTYIGSIRWDITDFTSLNGVLNDRVTTPQGNILAGLSAYGTSLLNPISGNNNLLGSPIISQATNPQLGTISPFLNQGLSIDNYIYHERDANVTLTHVLGRTSTSLTFFADQRDQLASVPGASPNSTLYGATASANRQLRTDLKGYVSLSYSTANELGGRDTFYYGTVGLDYSVSDTFSLYIIDRYLYRELNNFSARTTAINAPTSDEEVAIGIRRNF